MIDKLIQKKYFPLILFFFAFGLFVVNNSNVSIYILDEAKNSECAREMLEQNELLKPTFNYNLRKDKPPLHYFFMMVSYSIFGVNEWAARFFSAIFGALTILITFLYSAKFLNRKTAFFTSLVLLSSLHLNIQFHLAVPDPYLIFFFCWSLFLFYSALETGKLSNKILMYVAIGFATLTKGPVAIALPGLIFLLFLIFTKQFKWQIIKQLKPFAGIAIVLVIALPWFILNGIETNWEWTRDFFFKHNLSRFGGEMEGHGGIFLIPLLYVLIGMLPFSVFIIPAIKLAWLNKKNTFLFFNMITALTIIIFFSLSQTKLPNYTVPSYPFLAVIFAFYLNSLPEIKTNLKPYLIAILIISSALPVGGYFALKADASLSSASNTALFLLILPLGVIISYILLIKKKPVKSIFAIVITFILASVLFFTIIFPKIENNNPVKNSLQYLENKEIAYYKRFNSSYLFYLKKKLPGLEENEITPFFEKNPDGVLISAKKQIDQINLPADYEIIFSGKDLFEYSTTVLISKKH